MLAISRYQTKFNKVISDKMVQAMIKRNTIEPLRTQVLMTTYANYNELREACETYAQQITSQSRSSAQPSRRDPNSMEVDAFTRWGGGKGDKGGKGKGKGDKGGKAK